MDASKSRSVQMNINRNRSASNVQPMSQTASDLLRAVESGQVLKKGSRGAAVKDLQRLLNQAGASPTLTTDGQFGPGTERALKSFQSKQGLSADGKFGRQTLAALQKALEGASTNNTTNPTTNSGFGTSTSRPGSSSRLGNNLRRAVDGGQILRNGSSGAAVKDLQMMLNRAGASPALTADGKFGPGTERALKSFQSKHGLSVDGKFGRQTFATLEQVLSGNTTTNGGTTNNTGGTTTNTGGTTNNTPVDNTTTPGSVPAGLGQSIENALHFGGSIKRGSGGESVEELQKLLNAAGASPQLSTDGKFGPGTERGIRQFQEKHGLVADGKFGAKTWAKMKSVLGVKVEAPKNTGLDHVPGSAQRDSVYTDHERDFQRAGMNLSRTQQSSMASFKRNWANNRHRYESVSRQTGIPAELIAAIHWREASGRFDRYLHQGDPLGRPAVHVPRNIPVFHNWEKAAVHALNMKKSIRNRYALSADSQDVAAMLAYAERYNGLGYHNKGRISPYVYAGTTVYKGGKYVRDGVYDPNHKDQQLGVLAMLKAIS
ncbi:MAG TPA: hypothetical protein DCE42_01135 [Myxococcales bacterium]|nr:hypothetical protein [Deltaproteobacteria bacterium]MBU51453.1 hypothetical protein [Deltaproteobacteria bacterium]HAA53325.1 hypothetical protein [Myxococcales bacterium]